MHWEHRRLMPHFNEQEASRCSYAQQKHADDLKRGPSLASSLDEGISEYGKDNDHTSLPPHITFQFCCTSRLGDETERERESQQTKGHIQQKDAAPPQSID